LQMRLPIEAVEPMLEKGDYNVSARSENMIEAFKDFDDGKIHMKLKLENSKYSLEDHFYWVANFHYQYGIRPARIFESDIVRDFAEKYLLLTLKKETILSDIRVQVGRFWCKTLC